ncbi:MAG TPA: zf-HC2 domain-containing protein [Bacteroidales bacterium]|nr:zf-HC2 domain-containing protein [Bacteroidales bacterium]
MIKKPIEMNCSLCQNNLDAYKKGSLSSALETEIKDHLKTCDECSHLYNAQILADRIIDSEKNTEPNPFLITRIMSRIENIEDPVHHSPRVINILRPVFITLSLAAAIFFGVMIGNLSFQNYNTNMIPAELTMIDDAVLESIDMLSTEPQIYDETGR